MIGFVDTPVLQVSRRQFGASGEQFLHTPEPQRLEVQQVAGVLLDRTLSRPGLTSAPKMRTIAPRMRAQHD